MTTTWEIAPVVKLLSPGQEIDGRITTEWALVLGDGLSNRAVIEGTREELFRFAVHVGAAAQLSGYTEQPKPPTKPWSVVRTEWRLTDKGIRATGGRRAG